MLTATRTTESQNASQCVDRSKSRLAISSQACAWKSPLGLRFCVVSRNSIWQLFANDCEVSVLLAQVTVSVLCSVTTITLVWEFRASRFPCLRKWYVYQDSKLEICANCARHWWLLDWVGLGVVEGAFTVLTQTLWSFLAILSVALK